MANQRTTGSPLSLTDLGIAWIVLLALFFGYWNLVQFLLLPYEVRRQERELAQDDSRNPSTQEHTVSSASDVGPR